MGVTDADRAAFKRAELHRSHRCGECEAEARAQGYREALEEVRAGVEAESMFRIPTGDYVDSEAVLALLDRLSKGKDR